jgi:hypothetical protein
MGFNQSIDPSHCLIQEHPRSPVSLSLAVAVDGFSLVSAPQSKTLQEAQTTRATRCTRLGRCACGENAALELKPSSTASLVF